MKNVWTRLRGHFQEYVSRYAVLAIAVLTPAAGLLGTLAADLGGADTSAGRLALGAASALGTAAAGVVFIRNLGIWQMLDQFGTAPGIPSTTVVTNAPAAPKLPDLSLVGHPDEDLGAAEYDELPVSPDVERPAAADPITPPQGS